MIFCGSIQFYVAVRYYYYYAFSSYNSSCIVFVFLPVQPPEGKDNTSDDDNGVAKKRRSTKNAKEDPGWRVAVTNLPYHMCTVDTMHQVTVNDS